jgi:hypothetical protein
LVGTQGTTVSNNSNSSNNNSNNIIIIIIIKVTEKYNKHIPERVITDNGNTIMWEVPVITDRTIPADRPDILLHDKQEKSCLIIDIAPPDD